MYLNHVLNSILLVFGLNLTVSDLFFKMFVSLTFCNSAWLDCKVKNTIVFEQRYHVPVI